jgi:hypothetical protein
MGIVMLNCNEETINETDNETSGEPKQKKQKQASKKQTLHDVIEQAKKWTDKCSKGAPKATRLVHGT